MQSLYFDPLTPTLSQEGEGVVGRYFGEPGFIAVMLAFLPLVGAPLTDVDAAHVVFGGESDKS